MASLDHLKQALRKKAAELSCSPEQPLSDAQYSAGFDVLQISEWKTYQDFIIPQLSELLAPLFKSRNRISVLEIGPGPKSVLGYLPNHLRQKIKSYCALEPNITYATKLEKWFSFGSAIEYPLPSLENPPRIQQKSFPLEKDAASYTGSLIDGRGGYDVILFCHSMYDMHPKERFIEKALGLLDEQIRGAMVVIFHRASLHLDGLVSHRSSLFPEGNVCVKNDDKLLDKFAPFIAGFSVQGMIEEENVRSEWRNECRKLGRRAEDSPNHLIFSSPNIMIAFTRHATALPELTGKVPLVESDRKIKSWEARSHHPAAIIKPTEVLQVQHCVRWALKHDTSLSVIGGSHSGHCLYPNIVAVDMGNFNNVWVLKALGDEESHDSLIVAEAGCNTGDVVRKLMEAGVRVPFGSRPSVGAGMWLQGGIGHLSRLYGLTCDGIVGAVMVTVDTGEILCVGHVPSQHQPDGARKPSNEADILWAIKGAGSNFGIITSVIFKAYTAPQDYLVQQWIIPLEDTLEARERLKDFDNYVTNSQELSRASSVDAYLYYNESKLHLGVTTFQVKDGITPDWVSTLISGIWGTPQSHKIMDALEVFKAEMYMAVMHGGHGGGQTSSFKRCLFFKSIGDSETANRLLAAMDSRPTKLCYIHVLHGGGAIGDTISYSTAFGCRNWNFACVITGVWPRADDDTQVADAAVRWVYMVAENLLSRSSGVYPADLGPNLRDSALAVKAFGPNRTRLAYLKQSLDPQSVLTYGCPLSKLTKSPKLVILVTGKSCAGKDYCAKIWASKINEVPDRNLKAVICSISDVTKREYASEIGADFERLVSDRKYKEQHRLTLTEFFQKQVRQRPQLPQEHFLEIVQRIENADVLLITGMRDEAPLAKYSYLVPDMKLLDVQVQASDGTRQSRGASSKDEDLQDDEVIDMKEPSSRAFPYQPSMCFVNDADGNEKSQSFAETCLLPFLHNDLSRLTVMLSNQVV
ncbi:hypothetical protein N0V90_002123 [Kalmusia sp. IMI 367209]|nr:hypothetical protein N0V90_002123 [Kalmusia sp. IMI 367209]